MLGDSLSGMISLGINIFCVSCNHSRLQIEIIVQMIKHIFQSQISILLILTVAFTSCNGQVKTEKQHKNLAKYQFNKIPKPKGLNKDADIGFGIQDKSGNIWFGSYGEGVFKYDGKVFINYTTNEGLNSNTTYSIVEDKMGKIWVSTNKGINCFDGIKFQNIPIVFKTKDSMLSNYSNNYPPSENKIWSMMVDSKGTIWFGTDDGVYCYNGKEFTRFLENSNITNKDSLQLKAIFSILETNDGNIWFAACQNEGVSRFDGKTLSNIIPYKDVRRTDRVIEDKKGNLWFACVFKGVGRYDRKTYTQNVFKEKPTNGPSNIIEDGKGNIWFDTQEGLCYYDGIKLKTFNENESIPNKKLIPVFSDKSGHVWLSSKGMGLYQYMDGKFISYSE